MREFDRKQFNSDRRFYRYLEESDGTNTRVELICVSPSYSTYTVEHMLDDIENPKLFRIVKSADKVSQNVLLMRMNGIDYKEISESLGITVKDAQRRFYALKEKIIKIY